VRLAFAAALAAAAALFAASMLGVAVAEAPTVTSLRTVSVEGVATLPIAQNANAASATGIYHQAMVAAIDDGKGKAEILTGKVGAGLGAVQSVSEDGGEIECSSGDEEWTPYEGEQPDFGHARGSNQVLASAPAAASTPAARPLSGKHTRTTKHHKKRKHPTAKKATAPGCRLTAQVSLAYLIG
jgi:hypothetical protein